MRTKVIALTGFATSAAGVAASQALTANVALTLTTSPFVFGGDLNNPNLVTSANGNGVPQEIQITSASNIATVVFPVIGRDRYDNLITETITGVNANTVQSKGVYAQVLSINPKATNASAVGAFWLQRSPSALLKVNGVASNTGALTAVSGNPFALGIAAHAMAVDPTSHFLYAATPQGFSATVTAYSINNTTGALSPLGTFSTGGSSAATAAIVIVP